MKLVQKRCMLILLFAALVLMPEAQAQTVKVPKEVQAVANRLITVNVEWEGDDIKWTYDELHLGIFREYDPDPKKIVLKVLPYTNNRTFTIKFIACKDKKLGDFTHCDIVVGKPGPTPPPGPDPPPPDPIDDPLTKLYKIALDKETAADKNELLKKMIAVYEEIAEACEKPEVKTWGNVFALLNQYRDKLGVRSSILEVQKVSQAFFKERFSDDEDKAVSVDDKKLVKDTFKRASASLKPLVKDATHHTKEGK